VTQPFELRKWQCDCLPKCMEALAARRWGVVSAVMGSGKSILIREVIRTWLSDLANVELGVVVVTTPTVQLVEQLAKTFRTGGLEVGSYYTHAKEAAAPVVVCCNASARALADELAAKGRKVGLWIADEAHRTQSDQLLEAAEILAPVARLAVTATPFRSDERERISAFNETIFRYTPADALDDKVIVPPRIIGWEGQETSVDEACLAMIRQHAHGPGIVNALNIEDAEAFAARLGRAGFRAQAIHSRHSKAERDSRLAQLEHGELDMLVHVALLAEGVDMAWLRWLCMRRPVGARVRFIQEVGRVLRAFEGKAEAVLLDPHDLFGTFALTFADALGWFEPHVPEPREPGEEEGDGDEVVQEPEERRVRARGKVAAWARQLLLAMSAEWVGETKIASAAWKQLPPSLEQLKFLRTLAQRGGKYLPPEHRTAVQAVLRADQLLSRGVTSDLLSVLLAVTKRGEPWEPAIEVPAPSATAIERASKDVLPEDLVWRAAGVLLDRQQGAPVAEPVVAIVVLQGNRIVHAEVRLRRPGEQWLHVSRVATSIARVKSAGQPVLENDEVARRMAFSAARKFALQRRAS